MVVGGGGWLSMFRVVWGRHDKVDATGTGITHSGSSGTERSCRSLVAPTTAVRHSYRLVGHLPFGRT